MSDNYYLYLGGSSGNFGWWGLRGVRPRPADIFLKNIPLKIVNETTNFIKTVVFENFIERRLTWSLTVGGEL